MHIPAHKNPFVIQLKRSAAVLDLLDGQIVTVRVSAKKTDAATGRTSARIAIAGTMLEASDAAGLEPGDSFTARVRKDGNAVLLQKLHGSDSQRGSVCSRLGMPETAANAQVIGFMTLSSVKLDPSIIRLIVKNAEQASLFQDYAKKRAAPGEAKDSRGVSPSKNALFASWVLYEASVEAEPELIDMVIRGLEGDTRYNSLFAYLNHSNGKTRHWIVVPFERASGDVPMRGSVRFLIDLGLNETIRTDVWCETQGRMWDFCLTRSECAFTASPGFSSVTFEKISVYLQEMLSSNGIQTTVRSVSQSEIGSIDVRL